MVFRQPKSRRREQAKDWSAWLAAHGVRLPAAGLPPEVTITEQHWIEFLHNGWLDMHPADRTGFWFGGLSAAQMTIPLGVLDASPHYEAEPMVGWLRVRLGLYQ